MQSSMAESGQFYDAQAAIKKHDQHTLLEGHLPQGFYRAQGTAVSYTHLDVYKRQSV